MKIKNWILFLLFFKSLSSYTQCDILIKTFENELYSSKALREYTAQVDNPDKVFDAWRILRQEDISLSRDLAKIKDIEKNLELVKKAGGYKKWQSLSDFFKNNHWSDTDIDLFLDSSNSVKTLENAQSWKLLKDANRTKLMNDAKVIQKLTDVLADNSIRKTFGDDLNDIMKKFITAHKNKNWSRNKFSLETHLEKLKNIANKYEGVEGFNKSLRDALNNPAPAVQDGLWHMITDLEKRNISKDKIKAFDLEFDGENQPCIKCKFDVELITQNSNELKYLEYKSYIDASKISQPQFLNYIANINDIKQLQYVFSKNKLTLQEAKNGMKKFFDKNKEEVFKVMNSELKESLGLTGLNAQIKFNNLIEDTNSTLYNFIKN